MSALTSRRLLIWLATCLFVTFAAMSYAIVNVQSLKRGQDTINRNITNVTAVVSRSPCTNKTKVSCLQTLLNAATTRQLNELRGPAGRDGARGPRGPRGPQGATGARGPAGHDGARGPAGPRGLTGAMGPIGPIGPAGQTGPAGRQGPPIIPPGQGGTPPGQTQGANPATGGLPPGQARKNPSRKR